MERFIHVIEIPVTDIKRAIRFYSAIFDGLEFKEEEEGSVKYALFLTDDMCDNGILLVQREQYEPSVDGPLIYLDGGDDVNEVLSKVLEAGGSVVMEKTLSKQFSGYIGMFIDSEGNRMALHSFVPDELENFSG